MMSVLLIILMFALFITMDYVVTRRRAHKEVRRPATDIAALATEHASLPAMTSEPVWVAGYQLPEELHYHRGHTWARLVGPDTAQIGIDDFARKLIGRVEGLRLAAPGTRLVQGDPGFAVEVDGRSASFVSPISGDVVQINPELEKNPALVTNDPYGRGWLFKVRSREILTNLRNLLSGSLARRWMEDSRDRLELQLMAASGTVLQDGGEPVADFARHLDDEGWRRLVGEFFLD